MNKLGQYSPQEAANYIAQRGKDAMRAAASEIFFKHGLDKPTSFTLTATVKEVK